MKNAELRLWMWGIPIILFIIVLSFVGVGILVPPGIAWGPTLTETATPTPTPIFTPTQTPITPSSTPTTPSPKAMVPSPDLATPSPTPTTPLSEVVTPSPEVTTPTPTGTFTATPLPKAVVIAPNGLNLRLGPGLNYDPPIGFLHNDDILVIVGRINSNEWIKVRVVNRGLEGWIFAGSNQLIQINANLSLVSVVPVPPTPVPSPAPYLISPVNDFVSSGTRPDLLWEWGNLVLKDDYYYEITIWLDGVANPIDVAWIQSPCYRYDQVPEGREGQIWTFRWAIAVVKGNPGNEKQWSPVQQCGSWNNIRVFDPDEIIVKVSALSEVRSVKVQVQSPATPGSPPTENTGDNNHHSGGGGGGGGGCSRC